MATTGRRGSVPSIKVNPHCSVSLFTVCLAKLLFFTGNLQLTSCVVLLHAVNIHFQLGIQALSCGERLLAVVGSIKACELWEKEFAVCGSLADAPLPAVLGYGDTDRVPAGEGQSRGDCACVHTKPVWKEV